MDSQRKAQLARALEGNELWNIVLDECRQTAIKRWETSTSPDVHAECWAMVRAIHLLTKMIDGHITEAQI